MTISSMMIMINLHIMIMTEMMIRCVVVLKEGGRFVGAKHRLTATWQVGRGRSQIRNMIIVIIIMFIIIIMITIIIIVIVMKMMKIMKIIGGEGRRRTCRQNDAFSL